jgi:glutamyl-tRNA synthetase
LSSPAPRVRFAPSPTGYLHVGGARTALFNWLFARHTGGTFVLRIEDTDAARSSWEMVSGIVEGLRWLGLDWDEGPDVGGPHAPYFQSQRHDRHAARVEQLRAAGRAYPCYCTPESLKARREAAEREGGAWRYDGTCRRRSPEETARLEAAGAPHAIRFRVPAGATRFDDLVHGPIEFDHATLEDFIIARSDGRSTYHLSVVADDLDMAITHVVRGDDHISNTPKQVLLYQALGEPVPRFAHVPLILGPDKKRLSKRHGATSVMEYETLGYLPQAMVNFLALLGWSPGGGDEELFDLDALIRRFTLDGISGGNAVFNPDKLDWFNGQYLARLPAREVAVRLEPWLRQAALWSDALADGRRAWFESVLELLTPRARTLPQIVELARPFLADEVEYDPKAVRKHLKPEVLPHLAAWRDRVAALEPFDEASLESALRELAAAHGLGAASLIHATRVAVTGQAASPGLFEVLALVGRDRVVRRLERAAAVAAAASPP